MYAKPHVHSEIGLEEVGLKSADVKNVQIHWNLNPAELYEQAIRNGEAELTKDGAIRVLTGQYTGRSPKDKFFVEQSPSKEKIWWGAINQACSPELFSHMHGKVLEHLSHARNLYVHDAFCGTDERYRLPIRVISEVAYHALFSWNMFVRATKEELVNHKPQFTVLAAPSLIARPDVDGTRTGTYIGVNIEERLIVIVGSMYSGEVKKGIFSIMNYLLPERGVFPMHCSANMGQDGSTAVFFGLSGTGKTTLSADPERILIGDDEHGWSDEGVFNFEGGSYAKTINLSPEQEPLIYATTKMFGTVLENVPLEEDRSPDFADTTYTENTRCAYPLNYIPNASEDGKGGVPKNVVFLTADAFGVLPPISKLSPEQAMYHFISGYTAKVAGTERGITEPQATFSTCFGGPFMPLHPTVYAELLAQKIKESGASVWLVNTGWTGGPYGTGSRMKLSYTRRMVNAALNGELDDVDYTEEQFFGLMIPNSVPGVPSEILNPRATWSEGSAYDAKALELAGMFRKNFEKFADQASEDILAGGPKA
ncbi:phosphoenolpyruvate carboxykinase (ATP) [Phototrophicus methaneseepsis]|uniref:Phosphoenolpyruvate carboxykinase (ATP) n=1 Tax=Phototrophicus methaneseepsis TaxID=2710758 RepID=A0A7S8E741_9CHLR|nr:phosphoenolpyruvate carboxykinase (ATP) [Phototrophicus methaneseepsis]QPC81560.1 phosphoenolpyruvate carboxykinase (ATP) [Phototrophicus methaneseepsis]